MKTLLVSEPGAKPDPGLPDLNPFRGGGSTVDKSLGSGAHRMVFNSVLPISVRAV